MFPIRSFRRRLLLALLAVGLVPAALALGAGTLGLRSTLARSGTAGPWASVAESGQELLEAVEEEAAGDTALARIAAEHRQALSESVRFSRLYTLLTERFLQLLPVVALVMGGLVALLALVMARSLAASFSRPMNEIVEWTRLIARSEPLPPPGDEPTVREFEQLRDALRTMARQLEEARAREIEGARLRSWTEMARRVAHEIKNPLTPMRMAAVTVARSDEPAKAQAGEVLLEEIDRLDELARSFSQLGRMPEGPPSPIDVVELLEGLAQQHRGDGVVVRVTAPDELDMVTGHYEALVRVFRNLLINALEASDEAGRDPAVVDVTVEGGGDAVRVRIRDRGPGIPEEALDRIWSPEYTTKPRGTGFGLPLVRQTIRAHGGDVSAESGENDGAVFTVVLPYEGPTGDGFQGSRPSVRASGSTSSDGSSGPASDGPSGGSS